MEKEIEETKEKLEENEKKEETKEEKEIKDLKEKNKRLKDENKLLKDSINNRETKFWNKVVKLIVLAVAVSIIFIGINNLSNKYYIYKIINPTKDCCDIEKNYAIKESESQKKAGKCLMNWQSAGRKSFILKMCGKKRNLCYL